MFASGALIALGDKELGRKDELTACVLYLVGTPHRARPHLRYHHSRQDYLRVRNRYCYACGASV